MVLKKQSPPWFCKNTVTASLLFQFPEFCCENVLCVAGCYRHDIVANSQCQNCGKFVLCVSRHLEFKTKLLQQQINSLYQIEVHIIKVQDA